MASGHENRATRPNTWLLRPLLQREDSSCQPGAVHTWPARDMNCLRCYAPAEDTRAVACAVTNSRRRFEPVGVFETGVGSPPMTRQRLCARARRPSASGLFLSHRKFRCSTGLGAI